MKYVISNHWLPCFLMHGGDLGGGLLPLTPYLIPDIPEIKIPPLQQLLSSSSGPIPLHDWDDSGLHWPLWCMRWKIQDQAVKMCSAVWAWLDLGMLWRARMLIFMWWWGISVGDYCNFLGSLLVLVVSVCWICGKTTGSIFKILVPSSSSVSSASNCRVWRLCLYSKVAFNPLAAPCINILCFYILLCISIYMRMPYPWSILYYSMQ